MSGYSPEESPQGGARIESNRSLDAKLFGGGTCLILCPLWRAVHTDGAIQIVNK